MSHPYPDPATVTRRSLESYHSSPEPRPARESPASVLGLNTWSEMTTTHTTRRETN